MCANKKTKRPRAIKAKIISITLPEREGEMLKLYAKENGTTKPAAVRRMVIAALRQYKSNAAKHQPKNQLELFDTIQVDIFNNTSKLSD